MAHTPETMQNHPNSSQNAGTSCPTLRLCLLIFGGGSHQSSSVGMERQPDSGTSRHFDRLLRLLHPPVLGLETPRNAS